jgi:glycogen phosphorylase
MAETLYPGCDVWLNNPLRPLEACGTSGMKAALNGCLNLSILDGWWDEWYDGENGWAIPTAAGVENPDHRDHLEAAALYDLIEHSVAPLFYDRGSNGLPARWIEMVRHTLLSLGPRVLASRMVRDYVHTLYSPAAGASRQLDSDSARELAQWKAQVRRSWYGVRVDHVETLDIGDTPEVGDVLSVRAFVSLSELTPRDVDVQVAYGRVDESDRIVDAETAHLLATEEYEHGRWRFEGPVPLGRTGPFGFTVRILPKHRLLVNPAEMGLVSEPVPPPAGTDGAHLR